MTHAPSARPNILWVLTTQWRGQACGFAGDVNARTPALDAFAEHATVFDQAVSNHPFGPFARALLLTGRHSPANGVRDYWDPLPRRAKTVAHHLRAAGYHTAFFGKWHLARREAKVPVVGEHHAKMVVPREDHGGFEFWEGFESGFVLNNPWLHGTRLGEPQQFSGYQSDVLCERAANWMSAEAPADAPWFCVVSLEPPHPPYAAAVPPDIPEIDPATLVLERNVPRGGAFETTVRRELAGYYRHIEATDRAIGRLVAKLPAAETATFVTSVHGDMHGAHGLFRKGWPDEESIRVPLLARWPGAAPVRVQAPVSLADLPATTVALAGVEIPETWAGEDLRSIKPKADRAVLLGLPSVPPFDKQCAQVWRGVRTRDDVLIVGPDGRPWHHFAVRHDPAQLHDLVGDPAHADERKKLTQKLTKLLHAAGDDFKVHAE